MNLAQYQKDFLYCEKRFSVVEASTKAGKTQPHIFWLLMLALNADKIWTWDTTKDKDFWWVAPTYSQAEIAYKRMKSWVVHDTRFKIKHLHITTPLGSRISFKTADKPDSLYGEDVYGAVLDEFTRCKQDGYLALYSTLTATSGPLKMIGNYKGDNNWGAKKAKQARADDQYYYAKITAWQAVDAGILDRAIVEQAEKDLHPADFKALYLCEGSVDKQRLFQYDSILDLFSNESDGFDGEKFMSCDIAFEGSDKFVIAIWNGLACYHIEQHDKTSGRDIVDIIVDLKKDHGVRDSNIIYDADGGGMGLKGFMPPRSVAFKNNGSPINKENYKNIKAQCYYKFANMTRQGLVWILDDTYKDEIIEELEYTRKSNYDDDGKMGLEKKKTISKTIGRSPDFADALAYRFYFELKPKHKSSGFYATA